MEDDTEAPKSEPSEEVVKNGPMKVEEDTIDKPSTSDIDMKDDNVDSETKMEESDLVKEEAVAKGEEPKPVEERKGILTRLKTGVIQAKPINLDPYKTLASINSTTTNGTNEEVFVPKKDGIWIDSSSQDTTGSV